MADIYITGPRRVKINLEVHPAELANAIKQPLVLERFSREELIEMEAYIKAELKLREQEDNSGKN